MDWFYWYHPNLVSGEVKNVRIELLRSARLECNKVWKS